MIEIMNMLLAIIASLLLYIVYNIGYIKNDIKKIQAYITMGERLQKLLEERMQQ